ncbi:chemotaxis protein CheW [Novilysobacter spongiicola]|uniref:Chemosensory pili system protein ChpC n=1 Tax=Lysobacter spongiicola DSM 21749 TaxID=1122188 RepID=A0A1T4QZ36_9GAMM|nr:chemotaxis protein CheW [Lysobacter spongiicola]SKA08915.1 chemosensory pili system protein ChpC [Lysobacter spongiicola DSM 21749]
MSDNNMRQASQNGGSGASGTAEGQDVRGVLIQLSGVRLLLPNATIAEVLSYAPPEPVTDAPDWLLGRIRWRGWQVPLVGFSQLAGLSPDVGGLGTKMLVLKALGGRARTPFFAILSQGFPRLVTVTRTGLVVEDGQGDLPDVLQARVRLNEDDAFVPNLEALEQMVAEATAEAA